MQGQRMFEPDERIPFMLTAQEFNIIVEALETVAMPHRVSHPVLSDLQGQAQKYTEREQQPAPAPAAIENVVRRPNRKDGEQPHA